MRDIRHVYRRPLYAEILALPASGQNLPAAEVFGWQANMRSARQDYTRGVELGWPEENIQYAVDLLHRARQQAEEAGDLDRFEDEVQLWDEKSARINARNGFN